MRKKITLNKLIKAIRQQCVFCMGGNAQEVKDCVSPACSLFEYRQISKIEQ